MQNSITHERASLVSYDKRFIQQQNKFLQREKRFAALKQNK